MTPTSTHALDDALDRLAGYAFFDAPGFASHGPMGAETLCALGRDDAVPAWVETYKGRHEPLPAPPLASRIDPGRAPDWRAALGDPGRVSDWEAMFGHELQQAPWQHVVRRWVPVLLPGYGGALTHGLIRSGHAVRALASDPSGSEPLRRELARGLALWAAAFRPLPGRPALRGRRDLAGALGHVPRPAPPWTLFEAGSFSRIGELEEFPAAVEALGPFDPADDALGELTATFCGALLAHPEVFALPLVHAVTPVTALRTLQQHVPELTPQVVAAQVWHVDAAITAAFLPAGPPVGDPPALPQVEAPAPAELLARAVDHGDAHVLKFVDTCAREHSRRPDPVYLLAARHVIEQLPSW